MFAASRSCYLDMTIYHFRLLSCLFLVVLSSALAMIRTNFTLFWHSRAFASRHPHLVGPLPTPGPGLGALNARIIAALVLAVLSAASVYDVGLTPTPDFPQPAMAVPAHCFFAPESPGDAYAGHMRKHAGLHAILVVALCTFAVWSLCVLLLTNAAQAVEGEWFPYWESVMEREERWRRARLRLLALDCAVYAACSVAALSLAFVEHGKAQWYLDPSKPEREWAYGQIIAIALLVTPVVTFIEGLCCEYTPIPGPVSLAPCSILSLAARFRAVCFVPPVMPSFAGQPVQLHHARPISFSRLRCLPFNLGPLSCFPIWASSVTGPNEVDGLDTLGYGDNER
jgi:lysylphosphatidylglycerol synthetase-like protein (DUF2156 family)